MMKLFIDSDMGGDVDDALALTCALRSPQVEVVGLSTVYLRPEWRAQTAAEVFLRCGCPLPPIAAGCGAPLCGVWDESRIPDTGILPAQEVQLSPLHGSSLLLQSLHEDPELNILAIGPLTNLGLALLQDPSAFRRCHIYMMGGRVTSAEPEWNCLCDPEALRLVLTSGLDVTLVPFELTRQSQWTQAEVDAITGTPVRDYLRGMMNTFTQRFGFLPMMHDPMALAMLLAPELFTFSRRRIEVETRGEWTRGALVDFGPQAEGNVRVAQTCDLPAFNRWIRERLLDSAHGKEHLQ